MPFLEEMLNRARPAYIRLYFFVQDAEEVLDQAIVARDILFSIELREFIYRAHSSYREQSRERIHGLLRDGDFDRDRLLLAGLEGPQLDAKLAGYAHARVGLIQRGGLKALGRTLRWINAILGSLSAALPPAEALKELKELIENGAKDVRELEVGE